MRPIQTREWSARQTDFFCRVRNAQHGQEADHARVTVTCLPENHDRKPADVLWCHARFEEAGGEVTGFDFGKGFGGGRCPTREHAGVESNEPDRRALSSSVFYSLASILLPQNQARLLLETRERRDTPAGTRRSQWCCQTGRREKPQITTEQPAAIKQSVPAKTKGKIYCPVTSNRTPPTTGPRIPATPYAVKIQP